MPLVKRSWPLYTSHGGAPIPFERAVFEELNKLIDHGVPAISYEHEDLGAGADIAARPVYEARKALTVSRVRYIPRGASVGVDGSNTLVLTLRNITEGVDVATVTRTTNTVGGTPVDVPVTAANADIAVGDVLGLTVTQGATADVTQGILQVEASAAAAITTPESQD